MKKSLAGIVIISCVLLFQYQIPAQTPVYDVRVTDIRFLNGIGRGPTSTPPDDIDVYCRGYGLSGTLIEITADMNNGSWGAPLYGNTLFSVEYTNGTNTGTFSVTIPSGSNRASAPVPYNNGTGFLDAWITAGTTTPWTYTVTAVTGDYVNSLAPVPPSAVIYWDRNDPPSSGSPAIVLAQTTASTTSVTLYWNPINTSIDRDFYEYKIYFRESGSSAYKLWNGSHDSTLRGLQNNPTSAVNDPSRHFDANGYKYTTISNLKLFTTYEYFIAAVDVFGNEISEADAAPAAGSRLISTLPLTLEVTVSDGITKHSDFSVLTNPDLRMLREANIRVDIYTVTTILQPDECIVWFSTVATDSTDMVTPLLVPNIAGLGSDLDSVSAARVSPNKWTAYLPTIPSSGKNRIISEGNQVRFIVELKKNGVSTFVDLDSGNDPNNSEWTFSVGINASYKPWPAKILNNVITDRNPVAYPSYYLSEDAYVTIKVYDVKGRMVAVLLDSAFRRGGQNIKETGWSGSNKAGFKLGVGLYHVHFKAESVKSGKVILNVFKKVVMRR